MAHPSKYYIKFLMARGFGNSDGDAAHVDRTLLTLRLPTLTGEEYDRIYQDMAFPKTFRFDAFDHDATSRFMRNENIQALWHGDEGCPGMLQLLADQGGQLLDLKMLLLGRIEEDHIAQLLGQRYGTTVSEKTVERFRHYCWNPDHLDVDQWSDLLQHERSYAAYMGALCGGSVAALYSAGFYEEASKQRLPRDSLEEAMRQLDRSILMLKAMPWSPELGKLAGTLARDIAYTNAALSSEGADAASMLEALYQKMALVPRPSNVVPIRSLAATGTFSGSAGAVMMKNKETT